MAPAENETKLRQAFVDALAISPETDFESLAYRGIEEWDSVAHMLLVAEIEDVFEIMIDTDDVIEMSSYPAARDIVKKCGVEI